MPVVLKRAWTEKSSIGGLNLGVESGASGGPICRIFGTLNSEHFCLKHAVVHCEKGQIEVIVRTEASMVAEPPSLPGGKGLVIGHERGLNWTETA